MLAEPDRRARLPGHAPLEDGSAASADFRGSMGASRPLRIGAKVSHSKEAF
jgi:hypothetical protein